LSTIRIHGPFLFGTTDKLLEETENLARYAPIVILRLRNMTAIDATGLHALETLTTRLRESGRALLVCGAREQPARLLEHADFVAHIGAENILPEIGAALARARAIHQSFDGLGDDVATDIRRTPA
jgi:SulP family sulfate permease